MDILVNSPKTKLPEGRVDKEVLCRFAYCVLAADQLVAATNIARFVYEDDRSHLKWEVGRNVNPAVWVTLFLVLVTVVNMFPVIVCLLHQPPLARYL